MDIFGLGSDVVECLRIAQMIQRHGDLFLRRVYTPQEIDFCNARRETTQHFATFWAAKNATLRALGCGLGSGMSWRDMDVRHQGAGRTTLGLGGGVREFCEQEGVARLLVSVAYSRTHATAQAIALLGDCDDEE